MTPADSWDRTSRLAGLRRFAVAITVLNVLGHTVLGFEQSWAQPVVALLTAYGLEILFDRVDAAANRRPPRFAGGWCERVDFLLSAHITGLAVAMLLYANEQVLPLVFAVAVALGSKWVFRVRVGANTRHFLNPSNLGITVTLLLFPWVSIAPPYHFTENLYDIWDWVLPSFIILSGSFLNARFTHRLPLVVAWICGFALQALLRSLLVGSPPAAAWVPMTGVAFVLFTFYMVTDPATTPAGPRAQVIFGAAVAATYGLLMTAHVVFGLFFALTIVCVLRGVALQAGAVATLHARTRRPVPAQAAAGRSMP